MHAWGRKLRLLSTPASSSMQQFQKQVTSKQLVEHSATHTKGKRNTGFLRWVKCTKCTRWCDDLSYGYRPRQRHTKKTCARTRRRERERRRAARRCSNSWRVALFYKQRRTLTWENEFHRHGGVLQTPPNQARFRHVRVGKMHRDGGVRHAIVFQDATTEVTQLRARGKWAITSAQLRKINIQARLTAPKKPNPCGGVRAFF